jgi:hypothetical protein
VVLGWAIAAGSPDPALPVGAWRSVSGVPFPFGFCHAERRAGCRPA